METLENRIPHSVTLEAWRIDARCGWGALHQGREPESEVNEKESGAKIRHKTDLLQCLTPGSRRA